MNNRDSQIWEEVPYGEYLNAVDEHLEKMIGRESIQSELKFIAEMQEAMCSPAEAAVELIEGNYFQPVEREHQ
jgi:hypothetical protein